MGKLRWVGAVLVISALGTTGCQPARVGARCATTDWGEQGAWVLRCVRGRWQRTMTKATAARAIMALRSSAPPTTTTTTTVFTPTTPEEQRVHDLVVAIFGSSYWAGQVVPLPWRVVAADDPLVGGMDGRVWCRYRSTSVGNGPPVMKITPTIAISQEATADDDATLGDLLTHEGAHVIACLRWPEEMAPPGFPQAPDGADSGEAFAECFARYHRGPTYQFTYGCPNDELPEIATRAAVP